MQQTNQQIIATIVAVVILLITIGIIVLLLAVYYTNAKKRLLKEKEVLKTTYEKTILQLRIEVQEQTMQTIGADLHDNIGQLLSLTSLTLSSVELKDLAKAQQKIDSARDLTIQSIKEMRLLGKLLQGDQLISMGLAEAIHYEISWIEKSGKYEVFYTEAGEKPEHSNHDKDLILFRILQEVLNNIIKHSFANQINIKLEYTACGVDLQIIDNGAGFDLFQLPNDQTGMGLHNIRTRAEIVGGEVIIKSEPGEGTCIAIYIPYP
jgi:two-component system NarL family sensor kinase